jgi:hypothetical protein
MAKKTQKEIDFIREGDANTNSDDSGYVSADEYAYGNAEEPSGPSLKNKNVSRKPVSKGEGITLSKSKITLIRKLLKNVKENNEQVMQLLSGLIDEEAEAFISIGQNSDDGFHKDGLTAEAEIPGGRIIEGVFDGEKMIGPDGKQYSVPANYASKSKLVEGDIMKLTITPNGTFVYKQIGPIERARLIGCLELESGGNFSVNVNGRKLRVLTASVTFFKGQSGDEAVILVPKEGESKWAAVENVVRKTD